MRAIETLICHTEIEVKRVYFLRFCTEYFTRFSEYGIDFIVALSSTNATKTRLIERTRNKNVDNTFQYLKDPDDGDVLENVATKAENAVIKCFPHFS